jgi:hypothetical protein
MTIGATLGAAPRRLLASARERWLGAALLASVLLTSALAIALRPREEREVRVAFGPAPAPIRDDEPSLSLVTDQRFAVRTTAASPKPAQPAPAPDRAPDAVRALAASLRSAGFERRAFEAEARARLASLPAGAVENLQRHAPPDESADALVARAVLVRLADLPAAARAALLRDDVMRLRRCLDDDELPLGMAAQAGAALITSGNSFDREQLLTQLDSSEERPRTIARIALDALEGPGSGAVLVDALTAGLARGGDAPSLPLVADWMSTRASTLPPEERAHCASVLACAAERTELAAVVRARALTALGALDPQRAVQAAQGWLADPHADAALVRSACSAVGAGRVDAPAVAALLADPRLDDARRIAIAEACFGHSGTVAPESDVTALDVTALDAAALEAARDLVGPTHAEQVRARACFLLGSRSSSCVRGLEACTTADPDPLVRAAAERSARVRALRDRAPVHDADRTARFPVTSYRSRPSLPL